MEQILENPEIGNLGSQILYLNWQKSILWCMIFLEWNSNVWFFARALVIGKENGYMYINGFDHPNILAGAGTMGMNIWNCLFVYSSTVCL